DYAEQSRSWIDEWLLGRIISGTLRDRGADEQQSALAVTVIKNMTSHQSWFETPGLDHAYQLVETLLSDGEVQQLLRVNRYQDILWFDKHAFERLLWWMLVVAVVTIGADSTRTPAEASGAIGEVYRTISQLRAAAEASGYQVEKLLAMAQV
ncbi:MAG TPA: alpha-amylase, partial [Roseiflexaceae bacterium]|nr:alpha-amylase [Roseiflexaceae bacterium]